MVVFISVVRDAVLRRVVLDGLTAALGGFFLDGVVICWSPSVPPLETGDVFSYSSLSYCCQLQWHPGRRWRVALSYGGVNSTLGMV